MAALFLAGLLFALTATRGAPTAGAASCTNATTDAGRLSSSQIASAVACQINAERSGRGIAKVTAFSKLTKAAQFHTVDMQDNLHSLVHESSNGQSAANRIAHKFGYGDGAKTWTVGEDIAFCFGSGFCTPKKIVDLWLADPPHKKILLDKKWKNFGVGALTGTADDPEAESGALVTADFGVRKG